MSQARITGTTGAVFDFTSAGVSALSLQDAGVGPAVAGKLARVGNRLQWHDAGGARDVALILSGPLASQPAAGVPGRLFIATDADNVVYFDTGTSWLQASTGSIVATADLADGAVTTAKIAASAVDATKIAAGAVGTAQIADGAVTSAKLAPGAAGSVGGYSVRGLVGQNDAVSPNTKYGYAAGVVTLWQPSTQSTVVRANTGTLTNDVTVAGPAANGRDQAAAFPASSWIHFYFIWNGTTLATLSSLTAPPTGPTLPTGYTHWAYAGAVRWNATPALVRTRMLGTTMCYEGRQLILSGGTATAETAISLAAVVPPNALRVGGDCTVVASGSMDQSTNSGSVDTTLVLRVVSGTDYSAPSRAALSLQNFSVGIGTTLGTGDAAMWIAPNVGQTLRYFLSGGGSASISVAFYTVPNGDA